MTIRQSNKYKPENPRYNFDKIRSLLDDSQFEYEEEPDNYEYIGDREQGYQFMPVYRLMHNTTTSSKKSFARNMIGHGSYRSKDISFEKLALNYRNSLYEPNFNKAGNNLKSYVATGIVAEWRSDATIKLFEAMNFYVLAHAMKIKKEIEEQRREESLKSQLNPNNFASIKIAALKMAATKAAHTTAQQQQQRVLNQTKLKQLYKLAKEKQKQEEAAKKKSLSKVPPEIVAKRLQKFIDIEKKKKKLVK